MPTNDSKQIKKHLPIVCTVCTLLHRKIMYGRTYCIPNWEKMPEQHKDDGIYTLSKFYMIFNHDDTL
jgi:hypothetical protein